jgi:hypothetical protein
MEVDMGVDPSKFKYRIKVIMPTLDTSPLTLEKGVWFGPAQVVLADKTDVESTLREQTTSTWKKGWSEKAYDFPNTYVNLPLRVLYWNPITTFGEIQNERFEQRYYSKKPKTFNR